MKTKHVLFLHLGLSVVILTSCKKELNESFDNVNNSTEILSSSDALQWDESKDDEFIIYSSTIKNTSITSSVADNGLVLVFYKKQSGVVSSLPIDNSSEGYWYYQVNDGGVELIFNSQSGGKRPDLNDFLMVVFTPEKLAELTKQGIDASKILGMDYNTATNLSV